MPSKSEVFFLFFLALFIVLSHAQPPQPYSRDLETELRKYLFTGYEVLQRPAERVTISLYLTLLTVNELSIKDQSLAITAYFTMKWDDSRLSWNTNSTYDNIRFLFSTEAYVWRPSLIIDNAVYDLTVLSDVNIPIRIASDGRLTWNPAGVYTVACDSDITYYPLDIQMCTLSVSSWAYTSNEIDLVYSNFLDIPIDISSYSENGEWELISRYVSADVESKTRGEQTFSNLKFSIILRRRPLFHILNTLFPVTLMAILSATVFKLPPDSGEKIGFSLTVLLAYAVYLTLISDNIPSTSVSVCYLSIYLALILAFGTFSVLCTILVLNIHHRSDDKKPIPGWVRKIILRVLVKIVCWNGHSCCKSECRVAQAPTAEIHNPPLENGDITCIHDKTAIDTKVSDQSRDYLNEEEGHLTWQDLAEILDNFFFLLFVILIFSSTVVVFSVLLAHHVSE